MGEVFIIAGQSNAQGQPVTTRSPNIAEPENGINYVFDGVRIHTETFPDVLSASTSTGNPTQVGLLNRLTYLDKIAPYKSVAVASGNVNAGIAPMFLIGCRTL